MSKTVIALFIVAAAAQPARAISQDDRDTAISNLLGPLGDAIRWTKPEGGGGDQIKDIRTRCRDAIAEAKLAGLKPTDEITAWSGFEVNPKATAKPGGKIVTFKFADAGWYCDDLDKRTLHWDLVLRLEDGAYYQKRLGEGMTDDEKNNIAPELVDGTYDFAKRCTTALAAEIAGGATEVDTKNGKIKLADAAPYCDAIQKWGDVQKAAYAVRAEKVGAKYRTVGMKGDRLDLFIYYDDLTGWFLPGCKSSTMDPKVLVKQKALFQWLTGSSGLITIRKFAFTGDKYKITETQFLDEDHAYKGCR